MKNVLFIAVLGCSYTFLSASAPETQKPAALSAVAQLHTIENNAASVKKVFIGFTTLNPIAGGGVEVGELIKVDGVPLLGATDDPAIKDLRWAALQETLKKKYQK